MTREEAIKVISTEKECVTRNTKSECDRKCIDCDLLMDSKYIYNAYDMAITALQEPERKHGYWIEGKTHYEAIECHCSECDQLMTTYLHKRMKYCPNCGKIMDGKNGEPK